MSLLDRIIIVGATGRLGSALLGAFADCEPIAAHRAAYDLSDHDAMRGLVARYRPTVVINAAAYHNVELCEIHPERAMAINALAVDALAGACALAGATLVHISTDYVFDGRANRPYREEDAVNPLNAYGVSKAAGEQLVRRHGARHVIARTSGLYGEGGSPAKGASFVDRILAQAERGEAIRVVDDVTFSPSYARDVAEAIRAILERESFGTFHVTNAGACTWHAFAREAFRLADLHPADFEAVSSSTFDTYIARPAFSALELSAIVRAGIPAPPHWIDALSAYIAARKHARS
jgi:dTDP-4-dehydrorhamnose reductase